MGETKQVVWFADDPKPNKFFSRSPLRFGAFLFGSSLMIVLFITFASIVAKDWDKWSARSTRLSICIVFLLQGALYPFIRLLRRHEKVNELYLAGKIGEQSADSPLDEVLGVATNAALDAFLYPLISTFLLILLLLYWK